MIHESRARRHGKRIAFSIPFIYAMIIPIAFIDICTVVYQAVCFPLFGMKRVSRRKYFRFDRIRLPYLGRWDKANCLYCSYANGVMGFVKEVIAHTEIYWCPVRHKIGGGFKAPEHHTKFAPHGNNEALRENLDASKRI